LRAATAGAVIRRAVLAVISATSTVQGTFGSRRQGKAYRPEGPNHQACTPSGGFGENAPMTARVCENCAMGDDELVLVRRVYVVPPSWDTPGSQTVIAEPELWCISCISQYPCEIVDE